MIDNEVCVTVVDYRARRTC